MANEQFYKDTQRMADEPTIPPLLDKAPEDWTSQELEEAASVVYEFANLRDSKTGKLIKMVVEKTRLPELQRIGAMAKETAKQQMKWFENSEKIRKAKRADW